MGDYFNKVLFYIKKKTIIPARFWANWNIKVGIRFDDAEIKENERILYGK